MLSSEIYRQFQMNKTKISNRREQLQMLRDDIVSENIVITGKRLVDFENDVDSENIFRKLLSSNKLKK